MEITITARMTHWTEISVRWQEAITPENYLSLDYSQNSRIRWQIGIPDTLTEKKFRSRFAISRRVLF